MKRWLACDGVTQPGVVAMRRRYLPFGQLKTAPSGVNRNTLTPYLLNDYSNPTPAFHATFMSFAVRAIARTLCLLFFRLSSRCPRNLHYYSTPLYAFPYRYLKKFSLFSVQRHSRPPLFERHHASCLILKWQKTPAYLATSALQSLDSRPLYAFKMSSTSPTCRGTNRSTTNEREKKRSEKAQCRGGQN